jgi:hypothetical protein
MENQLGSIFRRHNIIVDDIKRCGVIQIVNDTIIKVWKWALPRHIMAEGWKKMTKKLTETKQVKEFMSIAARYCAIIDNRDSMSQVRMLQEIIQLLPRLSLLGMQLPAIRRFPYGYELPRIPRDEYFSLIHQLEEKFKGRDKYKQVFDSYDETNTECHGLLSDDLADIYDSLKPGLEHWAKSGSKIRLYIVWNWREGFKYWWGYHALGALYALYWLLFRYVENEYGDAVGIETD